MNYKPKMRKKVIVAEMLYPEGHRALNKKYIELLSEIADVTIIDDGQYFATMGLPLDIKIIKTKRRIPSAEKFLKIKKYIPFLKFEPIEMIAHFMNLISIRLVLRGIPFDKIILMSSRLDALSLSIPFFPQNKIAVFHHYEIDRLLERKADQFFFKRSYNKYDHLFLAEFIRDGLIKYYPIKAINCHIVYQPLIDGQTLDTVNIDQRNRTIIGLGQTCDRSLLDKLIQIDKEADVVPANKILLRDKKTEYLGKNLEVIKRYLTRDEFNGFLNNYAACVLMYPSSFNLRYSGILDDALSHGMSIYGNDMPVVRYFHEKYPKSCHIFYSIEELHEIACQGVLSADRGEIENFINSHSDDNIKMQLMDLI